MTKKSIITSFIFLLIACSAYGDEERGDIHITIENLRNSKGFVRISLYNSKEGFPSDHKKALLGRTVKIVDGKAEVLFENLPYGYYASGALHDENGNGRLDFNWFFLPDEGLGTSNNPEPKLIAPTFKESKVELKSQKLKINIHIYY